MKKSIELLTACFLLVLVGWALGIKTEQYLIKIGYRNTEKNTHQFYNDSIKNLKIGDEYLKDSCYDSTFKHIGQDDYVKQIGG